LILPELSDHARRANPVADMGRRNQGKQLARIVSKQILPKVVAMVDYVDVPSADGTSVDCRFALGQYHRGSIARCVAPELGNARANEETLA
jgi:hypothetical protein